MKRTSVALLLLFGLARFTLSLLPDRPWKLNSQDIDRASAFEGSTILLLNHRPLWPGSSRDGIVLSDAEDISNTDHYLDSPLSQMPSYHDETPQLFSREEEWLEEATRKMLDQELYPLGSLSSHDVETISGLMAAWVRRRSVEAALTVEQLLKRLVDDMRADNTDIRVTTRMYTYAIDAWARSGAPGSASRAQHIHDGLVELYEETKDTSIEPSVVSYNTLLLAWAKSHQEDLPRMAERVFLSMTRAYRAGALDLKPDAVTFSTMMDIYAKSGHPRAVKRCEWLFRIMDALDVRRNVYTFSALQNVYARSGSPDSPEKCLEVLDRMLRQYQNGDVFARPNTVNYNAVLNSYARAPSRANAEAGVRLLNKMELSVSEGGFDVSPDRLSYALTILACARCRDERYGARLAEDNLERMETRAQLEADRRREISSAAPPAVSLDLECFNVVLASVARSRERDSPERAVRILRRMQQYADSGLEHVRPNVRTWNAVLNSFSRATASHDRDLSRQAESVLNHMFRLYKSGDTMVKPDPFTFAAVLNAYQKSSSPSAAQRADDIVRRMEELYESGESDTAPDVYHYTILCSAWSRTRRRHAADRCIQILSHMIERHKGGFPDVKPNTRTFNAVLDCLAKAKQGDRAEEILYYMLTLSKHGDDDAKPDSFSFNCVIQAFSRSRKKGSGRRAEAILDRFLEFQQDEDSSVGPDARSFSHIIAYYGRCRDLDAPYRAEYLLNRMASCFKAGNKTMQPTNFAITTVIESYAYAAHPDAGRNAERLIKLVMDLSENHGARLDVTTTVMNTVLFAWANSNDENAGSRAEWHLDEMERRYGNGEVGVRPDKRSYWLVLSAWSKSSSYDKAQRALRILRRMDEQGKAGNPGVCADVHAYSLVINTCAFSNSGAEAEVEAFNIARTLMDELLQSMTTQLTSRTYGWFLQACGRLRAPDGEKTYWIEKAFLACCNDGLVNDFVLYRLKGAAPEDLLQKLMASAGTVSRDSKHFWPSAVHVPFHWKRRCMKKSSHKRSDTSSPRS